MSKKNIHGCVEISYRTKQLLTPKQQEDDAYVHIQCGGSDCREATDEEVDENLRYYKEHGECKFHIFQDTVTGCGYYSRDCLVCGRHIGLI